MTIYLNKYMRFLFVIIVSFLMIPLGSVFLVMADEVVDADIASYIEQDEEVGAADFGLEEPGVLPDGVWYGVKDFWRGLKVNFIFNEIDRAEARLDIANERLLEVEAVLASSDSEEVQVKVSEVIDRIGDDIERFGEQVANIEDKKDEKVVELFEKYADGEIKKQKIFDKIEIMFLEDYRAKIIAAKEHSGESMVEMLGENMSEDEFGNLLDKVMRGQTGSQFKDLGNLEVLERFKERAPEKAGNAIDKAQMMAMKRIGGDLNNAVKDADFEKVKKYLVQSGGNALRKMKVVDRMEIGDELSEDVKERIDDIKERLSERVGRDLSKFGKQFLKEKYLEVVMNNKTEDVRALGDVVDSIDDKDLQKRYKEVKDGYKERVRGMSDEERKELKKELSANINLGAMRLIYELGEDGVLGGEIAVREIKSDAMGDFLERFRSRGDKFVEKITNDRPEDLEVLSSMREAVNGENKQGLERVLEVQMRNIERRIDGIKDLGELVEYQKRLENTEGVRSAINSQNSELLHKTQKMQMRKYEEKLADLEQPEEIERFKENFKRRIEADQEYKKRLLEYDGEFFDKLEEKQYDLLKKKVNQGVDRERNERFEAEIERMEMKLPRLKEEMKEAMDEVMNSGLFGGDIPVDESGLSVQAEKMPVDLMNVGKMGVNKDRKMGEVRELIGERRDIVAEQRVKKAE